MGSQTLNGSVADAESAMPRAKGARSGIAMTAKAINPVLLIDHTEAARRLAVSPSHLHALRKAGKICLKLIRLGRAVRFLASEVAAWADAGGPPCNRWQPKRNGGAV